MVQIHTDCGHSPVGGSDVPDPDIHILVLRCLKGYVVIQTQKVSSITSARLAQLGQVLHYFLHSLLGHAVSQLVEALRYQREGRGFNSRWCH